MLAGAASSADPGGGGAKLVGLQDAYVIRTNAADQPVWKKLYTSGAGYQLDASGIAAVSDGGFILAGTSNYVKNPNWGGYSDAKDGWLGRIDGDGKLLWSKTYGGATSEWGEEVAALKAGGFALFGRSCSKFPQGDNDAGAICYFWLVRTEATGETLWTKTYGEDTVKDYRDSVVNALVDGHELADGGFALGGDTSVKGYYSEDWVAPDFLLVRTDAAGKLLWSKKYGGKIAETATGFLLLPDGGFAMIGVVSNATFGDTWLVRTDAAGNVLWSKNYDENSSHPMLARALLPEGDFAITNETLTYGPQGESQINRYVSRVDSLGNLLWKTALPPDWTTGAFAVRPDGGFELDGYLQLPTKLPQYVLG